MGAVPFRLFYFVRLYVLVCQSNGRLCEIFDGRAIVGGFDDWRRVVREVDLGGGKRGAMSIVIFGWGRTIASRSKLNISPYCEFRKVGIRNTNRSVLCLR